MKLFLTPFFTSERSALPLNETLDQIEQQAGTAFDPMLTELYSSAKPCASSPRSNE
jgi:hypothetical protein